MAVGGGIIGQYLIGHYFIGEHLNGMLFLDFLIIHFLVQMGGSTAHFHREVRGYLNNKWIPKLTSKSTRPDIT